MNSAIINMLVMPLVTTLLPCILCCGCIATVVFYPQALVSAFSYVPWLCGMIPWGWVGSFFKNFFEAIPFGAVADGIENVIGDIF